MYGTADFDFPPSVLPLVEEAKGAERQQHRDAARALYNAVLARLDRSRDAAASAGVMRWVGRTYIDDAELEQALHWFASALAVADAVADRPGVAHAYNLMAIVHQQRGQLDDAELFYRRARGKAQEAGELRLAAMTEQNLGTVANTRGDLRLALKHYLTSLRTYRELGLNAYVGPLLNNLGMVYTDLRRWRQAERAYDEARTHCLASGDAAGCTMVEVNRAELWIARREFARARAACDAALALAGDAGDDRALGETCKHLGVIERETGNVVIAEAHLARALQIAEERQDLLLAAETSREQAELYWRLDRHRETLVALTRAHRLFSTLHATLDLADVARRMRRLETMFLAIVRTWGASIETKDAYTHGHCDRATEWAVALAAATGLDERTLYWFRLGSLLHDVGKIGVPAAILNKPGRLTPDERTLMEHHAAAGAELVADVDWAWDIRPMIRHHHERWDGSGYPDRLAGEAIPLAARILCIADVYDALTSDRPYRKGFSHEQAMEIMRDEAGRMFDPALFECFEGVMDARRDALPAYLPPAQGKLAIAR
ncbi:MAG: HD domain-containing phosphohydrolase [Gemmatimonadaceae bacterium]